VTGNKVGWRRDRLGGSMVNTTDTVSSPETKRRSVPTMACIDVRLSAVSDNGVSPTLLETVLDRVQGAVRADDRVCPMGTSRLAVEFGPVANGVPPHVLGYRLAQAIGRDLPLDTPSACLSVSVGMAAPRDRPGPADLTRNAMAAALAGRSQLGRRPLSGTQISNAFVTVDSLVAPQSSSLRSHHMMQAMHRRDVFRYHVGRSPGGPQHVGPFVPPDTALLSDRDGKADLTVLVIDPVAERADDPGFATITAASVAEGLGCRSAAVAATVDHGPAMAIDGYPVDLVVLVLEGGSSGHPSTWASGAWGVPASLTASYRAAAVPVLAVSAGAGAGAVASCVAQGALALFSLDHLPNALVSLSRYNGDELVQGSETPLPPQFRALVGLTASERRILFYLTEGWAAQDIADELVVSLTTVRSHIRSTLRKLGVRSQLAAVAIANSRDLEHALSGDAS
jgi:DNA-binding NarL/FixJ family response regulator